MNKCATRSAFSFFLVLCTFVSAFAAESITITATPRYPWNGKVDLKFTIDGTSGTKYDTSFTAKDVAGGTNLTMKTLYKSNGTAANAAKEQLLPGTYNWVWDATADLGEGTVLEKVVVEGKTVLPYWYVKFNANGGTGTMANEEFQVGVAKALTANAFTRAGYTFQGWATSASGAKVYSDKQSVTDLTTGGNTLNLYAVWKSALYMVIDLSGGSSAKSYPVSYLDAVPSGGWSDTYRTTKLVLRRCEAGTFTMDGYGASKSHKVILTRPFYIGIFELTQKQYLQVTGGNPSYHVGNMLPVESMTWLDIRSGSETFIGRLKKRSGYGSIDLPTEAQWEYAGKGGGKLGGVAASSAPAKVGSKTANGWGIYDMQGNVDEWMLDGYAQYGTGTCTDPMGSDNEVRVIKGGYYGQTGTDACNKIGYRTNEHQSCQHQYTGFRVCVTVK